MSTHRTLAVVHNNIDPASSIGAIALWNVREALDRGWEVTAVCRDLDPSLVGHVRHVPLYVPPRLHLVQWAAARATVRTALRGVRHDVLLVHQPQLAAIADVWNVHYLSRAARESAAPPGHDLRSRIQDAQAAGVAVLEDRYLSRLPDSVRVLFCSELLRDHFERLYGRHPNAAVLHNPALIGSPSPKDQLPDLARRRTFTADHGGPVVGFLGGADQRKGGDLLTSAVAAEPELFLLHAGSPGLDTSDPRLAGRTRYLGYLSDVAELLDVVDALVVPSRFDPFPLSVLEAMARGVPVVVAPEVGSAHLVESRGAGHVWVPGTPLAPLIDDLTSRRRTVGSAARRIADDLAPGLVADRLFGEIDSVLRNRADSPA